MSTKKAIRGKRYSAEEKTKIIAFVNEHNAKNKRGGQLTAAKKFGISQLTIATWLKKSGGKAAAKGAKKTTAKSTSKAVTTKGSMEKKLNSLLSLGKEMEKLERDLKAKRAQFDSIKASL
jgi:transposase-like protein